MLGRLHEHLAALWFCQPIALCFGAHKLGRFLKATGRKGWMLYVPMTIMFCVTMTALGMSVWRIFGTISAGTFVFMVDGLQLIIAVALIALALMVVMHCLPKLSDKKAN
ncbi:MAG TPA: hypothetical protein OIM53_04955 [Sutterellaceae bacterium]|nr:hypothetical protein [Sutterellaceae bacterium]